MKRLVMIFAALSHPVACGGAGARRHEHADADPALRSTPSHGHPRGLLRSRDRRRRRRSPRPPWEDRLGRHVLASDTAANLDTLAGSLDLATVTSSTHPSPTEDACDTALIADAQ